MLNEMPCFWDMYEKPYWVFGPQKTVSVCCKPFTPVFHFSFHPTHFHLMVHVENITGGHSFGKIESTYYDEIEKNL